MRWLLDAVSAAVVEGCQMPFDAMSAVTQVLVTDDAALLPAYTPILHTLA
jgi:hypothetical protein